MMVRGTFGGTAVAAGRRVLLMRLPSLRSGARILFITNTRIGDVVLSTGLLGLLADTFPTSRITVVAGYLACSLFDGAPCIERVIPLRKQPYNRHWFGLYLSLLRAWDLVIDLRGSALAWMVPTWHRRIMSSSDPARSRVVELGSLVAPIMLRHLGSGFSSRTGRQRRALLRRTSIFSRSRQAPAVLRNAGRPTGSSR